MYIYVIGQVFKLPTYAAAHFKFTIFTLYRATLLFILLFFLPLTVVSVIMISIACCCKQSLLPVKCFVIFTLHFQLQFSTTLTFPSHSARTFASFFSSAVFLTDFFFYFAYGVCFVT